MIEFLQIWAESTWLMLVDSAFLFMVGLAIAGLIWLYVNEQNVGRYIQDSGFKSVVKAALIGIPLPLCSCSVLPVVAQLRKSGASKEGIVSFLVATPESGADSILLTYSLTDPILTVARPLVAMIAAMTAGAVEVLYPSANGSEQAISELAACNSGCGCGSEPESNSPIKQVWYRRFGTGIYYAFTDLLKDLSPYLFLGFCLAGLIGAILTTGGMSLSASVLQGWIGYVGAIVIGLPMYICASSSTPLAAVLLAAGFSPGAILIFLLVGPATNIASLIVVKRIIGYVSTVRYLLVIVIVAVLGGLATDYVYELLEYKPVYDSMANGERASWLALGSAGFLGIMIFYYSFMNVYKRLMKTI